LGELVPVGQGECSLGQFFENYRICPNFSATFSTVKFKFFFLTKNWLGSIVGDILHNLIWSPCWASKKSPYATEMCRKRKKKTALQRF
jgi:hypothetical protein